MNDVPGRGYSRARRNALIDKFYADALTLEEARELRGYVDRDVLALKKAGHVGEDLYLLMMLQGALFAVEHLLAESRQMAAEA